MPKSTRIPAHSSRKPKNPLFIQHSRDRVAANLSWLSSAAADQALLAGSCASPSSITAELLAISARLDVLSTEIGGAK